MSTDVLRQPIVDGILEELSRKSRDYYQGLSIPRCVLIACWVTSCVATGFAAESYELRGRIGNQGRCSRYRPYSRSTGNCWLRRETVTGRNCQSWSTEKPPTTNGCSTGREHKTHRVRSVRKLSGSGSRSQSGAGGGGPQLNRGTANDGGTNRRRGASCSVPWVRLTRDDLDLIDIQGNSLAVSGLLPDRRSVPETVGS